MKRLRPATQPLAQDRIEDQPLQGSGKTFGVAGLGQKPCFLMDDDVLYRSDRCRDHRQTIGHRLDDGHRQILVE